MNKDLHLGFAVDKWQQNVPLFAYYPSPRLSIRDVLMWALLNSNAGVVAQI